jgi:hypothetical protein
VSGYSSDHRTIWASAGDYVHIVVAGDGDTDLDLYVFDRNGRVMGSDEDGARFGVDSDEVLEFYPADLAEVIFRAPYTGTYRIKVVNLGSVYNRYLLAIDN